MRRKGRRGGWGSEIKREEGKNGREKGKEEWEGEKNGWIDG